MHVEEKFLKWNIILPLQDKQLLTKKIQFQKEYLLNKINI